MNKQRKTSHILNVFQYDADGHVVLPASLTLSIAPGAGDNNSKVPTTSWVRTYVTGLTYATQSYVSTQITNLIDAAPGALDTLNELAAALGDDPNFATTITNSLATKLALTGGTLTGDLTLSGTNPRLYFTDTDNNPDYFISNTDGTFTVYDVTNSVGRFKIYTTGHAEFTNNVTAASFIKSGGTSAQFLMADGSVSTNPGWLTGITSSQVTTALGYTPVTNARTITINGTAYDLSADRSWSIASGVTSFNTRTGAITLSSADVTGALGFTPYNNTNPSGYITGITSANVTTALGFTPYNSTNPSGYITSSGTAAAISQTVAAATETNLVYATIADNDFFRIRVGGASNAGWAEIATADDGTEPIYVRQYTGVFSSVTRTATLLDGSGNTSFPGTVTAPTFSGALSGNASTSSSISGFNNPTAAATANTIAYRDGSGDLYARYFLGGYVNTSDNVETGTITYIMAKFGDNYHRSATAAKVQSFLGLGSAAYQNTGAFLSSSGSVTVGGYLTITGAGSSSSIYMSDTDEGQREIHCNSNRIGFLTQAGAWGAWCDDSGNWNAANFSGSSSGTNTGDQTNISGNAATANGANGQFYIDDDYGNSIIGVYSASRFQGVYSMGAAYVLPTNGTTPGNLYGLAWSHPNAGGQAGFLSDHGLLVMINGVTQVALSSNIWARGTITANAGAYANGYRLVENNGGSWGISITGNAGSASSVAWGNVSGRPGWMTSASLIESHNNANDWRNSGFYENDGGGSNWPSQTWYNSINVRHSNQGNYHGFQVAMSYYSNLLWFRSYQGSGSFQSWVYAISSANIGSQSVNYANSAGSASSASTASTADNLSGFDKTNPSFGAVYATNWFRNYGDSGLYNQDYSCHFRRNTSSSHGTWEIFGYNKGGYAGLNLIDPQGYWNNLMFESGNGGLYQQNGNGWLWYYSRSNNCFSMSTGSSSGSYRAYVGGSLYAEGDIVAYSDARLKRDIVTIDNPIDKVTQMRGVYYTKIGEETKGRQTGVIAQEMNEVLPEVVTYASDIDTYGVSYGNIVGVLIEAIKEQQTQIENLTNKIDLLTQNK